MALSSKLAVPPGSDFQHRADVGIILLQAGGDRHAGGFNSTGNRFSMEFHGHEGRR